MNYLSTMNEVNWVKAGHTIPAWQNLGISHYFGGLNAEDVDCEKVHQVHGHRIVEVDLNRSSIEEADGLFACQKGVSIGVQTADCLPLLMWNQSGVLAIHAGWRGLASGIVGKGIELLGRKGIPFQQVLCGLGPCIGPGSFEVGPEVVEAFRKRYPENWVNSLVYKGVGDRWFVDLAVGAILELVEAGIPSKNITVLRDCTFKNGKVWNSFRRQGSDAGRNWSWVSL